MSIEKLSILAVVHFIKMYRENHLLYTCFYEGRRNIVTILALSVVPSNVPLLFQYDIHLLLLFSISYYTWSRASSVSLIGIWWSITLSLFKYMAINLLFSLILFLNILPFHFSVRVLPLSLYLVLENGIIFYIMVNACSLIYWFESVACVVDCSRFWLVLHFLFLF